MICDFSICSSRLKYLELALISSQEKHRADLVFADNKDTQTGKTNCEVSKRGRMHGTIQLWILQMSISSFRKSSCIQVGLRVLYCFRFYKHKSLCLSVNVPFYLNSKVNGQVDIQLWADAKG